MMLIGVFSYLIFRKAYNLQKVFQPVSTMFTSPIFTECFRVNKSSQF